MSERIHHSPEHQAAPIEASAELQKAHERREAEAKNAEKDPLQNHIESLAKAAEQQAISGQEFTSVDKQSESSSQQFGVHKGLKKDSYKMTLSKIQNHLPMPQRVMSKVIHQPVVDAVSNATAKTVARPSGFLGGSIIAFLGSIMFLYMAKHYGFTYNYAVLFMLFVGGFALGLVLELLLRVFIRRRA